MIKKAMVLSLLGGLSIALSSCGSKTTAPAAPVAKTSPATTTTAPSTSSSAEVAVTGKWEMVGKEGEWQGTVDMVGMDGFIWSVKANGSLYKTDPNSGTSTQVGEKGSFERLKLIVGMDHKLWSVEKDTLYKSDPNTGVWERSGEGGGWARTIGMVGLNGILYSIEPDGSLWKTEKSGEDTLIDKGGFKGCTQLTEMGGKLWTIEEDTLYQTDPATLKWTMIGKEGGFANISAMEGTGSFIWMLDSAGNLYKVDKDGTKTKLGDDYGQTTILTTLNGKLWTVEGGSLYRTS
jgi:hypothetical protein